MKLQNRILKKKFGLTNSLSRGGVQQVVEHLRAGHARDGLPGASQLCQHSQVSHTVVRHQGWNI